MHETSSFADQLANPPREYRPVAFWFLNHRLEPDEMVRQVREMADKGMGGFMCHGRDGLRTGYLREDWKAALNAAFTEAERLGLQVWLYDENHYPSGPADNQLPMRFPNRTMKSMAVLWEGIVQPGQPVQIPLPNPPSVCIALASSLSKSETVDLSDHIRSGQLQWTVPRTMGPATLLVLGEVAWAPQPSHKFSYYPDYFDAELTDEFIRITHEWYARSFGDKIGTLIRGIFSDNSCANFGYIRRSIPWGKDFESRFKETTGESLRQILPGLFYPNIPDARRARLVFWRFMGRAYLDAYFGRIKAFCDRVGLYSTGHLCLEDGMGEHARQIGDYFDVMRHFSLTAVDQLGPGKRGDSLFECHGESLTACLKNTSSAACYTGSPRVMCESVGCASGPWLLDLYEIKRITGWMAALGVDLFVPHGLYYSIAESRKWECTPDHYHNPMWSYYKEWTDWIGRLCTANAGGVSLAETAILYPIHALRFFLELGVKPSSPNSSSHLSAPSTGGDIPAAALANSDRGVETDFIEATYRFAINALFQRHIDFEVLDEEMLASAAVSDHGTFIVPTPKRQGGKEFRVLILPSTNVIEKRTVARLETFVRAGGRLILLNAVPEYAFDTETGRMEKLTGMLASIPKRTTGQNGVGEDQAVDRGLIRQLSVSPSPTNEDGMTVLANHVLVGIDRRIMLNGAPSDLGRIVTRAWENQGHRFYYLFNASCDTLRSIQVEMNERDALSHLNLQTGVYEPWTNPSGRFNLNPAEGVLLATGIPPRRVNRQATLHSDGIAKTIQPIEGDWAILPDRHNVLPLREWATTFQSYTQYHRFVVPSACDIQDCRLLLDLERSNPEFDSHAYSSRLKCVLNGRTIGPFVNGRYLDWNIYEAPMDQLHQGSNLLEIFCSSGNSEYEPRLCAPMIIGRFGVKTDNGKPFICPPIVSMNSGSWVNQGFPFFAGEIIYRKTISLPAVDPGQKLILDLGSIENACRVDIQNTRIGTRIAPPWRFDLTAYAGRSVSIDIRVCNTPHNLFMKEPKASGLLGPVCLQIVEILEDAQ